jgi:hypothetical protein
VRNLRRQRLTITTLIGLCTACLIFAAVSLPARASNPSPFGFNCDLGSESVQIATEGGRLVYRYTARRKPELVIREDPAAPNLFYRRDALGTRGEGQQLRFVHGRYSYVLSSRFIAVGGADEVKFFVLRDHKAVLSRLCHAAPSFEEYAQFDHLHQDVAGPVGY